MVMAAMPVNASEIGLQPSDSQARSGHSIAWVVTYTEPTYDVSAGDKMTWYNFWSHEDGTYQNNYQVFSTDKFSNSNLEVSADYNNPSQPLSFILSYGQWNGGDTISSAVTGSPSSFSRTHVYQYYIPPNEWDPYSIGKSVSLS